METNMIIGNFTYDAKANTYLGDIVTLNFSLSAVSFVPNEKNSDKEPDYRVVSTRTNGTVELGAGWKRSSERGTDFISVSLDGPLLPSPFNAALFTDGETASLVWTRPKPQAVANNSAKVKSKKAA
jgi:uncharacterized protein (DUF736 family)